MQGVLNEWCALAIGGAAEIGGAGARALALAGAHVVAPWPGRRARPGAESYSPGSPAFGMGG